jgi:potassium/hydrogen antiporter
VNLLLFAGAALVFISILLTPISARIGAPLLLLFLGLGMLLGENGPGGIEFDHFDLAYDLGGLALAIILLSGGLDTSRREVRRAAAPALVLATLGVVLTSAIVGGAAAWLFGTPLTHGLLLGAVVGSTDAAATFLLLQQGGVRLKGRVRETLLVESGINDPMAIFLTTSLVVLVDAGAALTGTAVVDLLPSLLLRLGLGVLAGVGGGWALARLIDRIGLHSGLEPPFALAGAIGLFAATQAVGGSGFLAIYLCGVALRAWLRQPPERIVHFHEGLAWLAQIAMLIMLGLLVTPVELGAILLPALAMAGVLIFVARPLAVLVCLVPFRFPVREQLYIGWVGLRGAVPIFLAIIPVISPGPITVSFFNIVFVIVVVSLVLQGWTIALAARWLDVAAEDRARQVVPASSASEAWAPRRSRKNACSSAAAARSPMPP